MTRASLPWPGRAAGLAALAVVLGSAACGGAPGRHPAGPIALAIEAVDGGVIDLGRYRGKPVVLHLFTTWSLTAQGDVQELLAANQQYGERVTIVGIAMDQDGYRLVAPWRDANRISYLVGLASPDLAQGRTTLGHITEVPTTIILGPDGRVAHWLPRPLGRGELARLLGSMLPGR